MDNRTQSTNQNISQNTSQSITEQTEQTEQNEMTPRPNEMEFERN